MTTFDGSPSNLTHLFAFSPPIVASANDSASSRLGHASRSFSLESDRRRDHDAAYRLLLPITINNEHPCLMRSRRAEPAKRIAGYQRGRERFTTLKSLRRAAWSLGGVFFPVSNVSKACALPNLWQVVTRFLSNGVALGATTRSDSHRDRFVPRFVKRRECSRPDLPSIHR